MQHCSNNVQTCFLLVAARRIWLKEFATDAMLDIIDLGESVEPWWQYEGVTGLRFKGFANLNIDW